MFLFFYLFLDLYNPPGEDHKQFTFKEDRRMATYFLLFVVMIDIFLTVNVNLLRWLKNGETRDIILKWLVLDIRSKRQRQEETNLKRRFQKVKSCFNFLNNEKINNKKSIKKQRQEESKLNMRDLNKSFIELTSEVTKVRLCLEDLHTEKLENKKLSQQQRI
mmetsp:Transcript_33325/g.39159  ORF Transcript_33325/g.39159 Transcript_33325/m.39159 type:complete len:162 (+) Transcript_33325:154-639(+)